MTGTIARVRFAKLGPHLIEVLDGGAAVVDAAVSEQAPGPGAWDRRLAGLGYVRVGDWRPEQDGWVCPVAEKERDVSERIPITCPVCGADVEYDVIDVSTSSGEQGLVPGRWWCPNGCPQSERDPDVTMPPPAGEG